MAAILPGPQCVNDMGMQGPRASAVRLPHVWLMKTKDNMKFEILFPQSNFLLSWATKILELVNLVVELKRFMCNHLNFFYFKYSEP